MNFLGLLRRSSRKSISPDVKLGRDVKLYDFVNLYGCEIGDDSRIGTFVEIQRGARIGGRQPGAIVAGKPGARREITRGA
jgi:UDP-3-O-[3-hydroxymyristoyl] glucosamine N-acyltransferase